MVNKLAQTRDRPTKVRPDRRSLGRKAPPDQWQGSALHAAVGNQSMQALLRNDRAVDPIVPVVAARSFPKRTPAVLAAQNERSILFRSPLRSLSSPLALSGRSVGELEEDEEHQELSGEAIQTSLLVGTPGGTLEGEADRTADAIMRAPRGEGGSLGSRPPYIGASSAGRTATAQRINVPRWVENKLRHRSSHGEPLSPENQRFFESRLGAELTDVRIHKDSQAAVLAESLGARAFTRGSDIFFGRGQFAPGAAVGRHLLAHELAHVLQQGSRQSPRSNPGSNLIQRAPWYKPWLQDYTFTPTSTIGYINVKADSVEPFDTGWQRDAVGTGLLSALGGVATAVIAKRVGLKDMLALLAGGASAYARGYMGYHAQERVWGSTVQVNNWYGRYRVNVFTGTIRAVDFHGTGTPVRTLVAPYYFQQRVADADGNAVYTHWRHDMRIPGVDVSRATSLPERSFGSFD
jgi:hypothetical protein